MSNTPNGPGWWQASDGRWYPPESHPSNAAGRGLPQPTVGYGPPPVKTGMPTWAKAVLIIGGVLVLLGAGCSVFVGTVLSGRAGKSIIGGGDCSIISNAAASEALGANENVLALTGLVKIAGVALDNRVLTGAPGCMLSPGDAKGGFTGRVALLQSSDATKVFQTEVTKAHGTKVDKGNGLTVESEVYYAKPVQLGDEAFCTTIGLPPSVGVLVRKGDRLVYASLSSRKDYTVDSETDMCASAQKLARAVLGL